MTPFETVLQHFTLPAELYGNPFVVHPLQIEAMNVLADNPEAGVYLDVGTGKTLVETLLSLYRMVHGAETTVLIMPPLLLKQWRIWLGRISRKGGSPLKVCTYAGTPSERAKLDFNVDFVLVGIQIFKRDYDRFSSHFLGRNFHVGVDEATMLANPNSDNHQKVHEFVAGMSVDLLTGTPANNPMDAYGLIKFVSPGVYRSRRHFENIHVEDRDFFGNPTKYQNLDVLKENLERNSYRILFEEMYPDTETPLFVPQPYDLEPAHLKLYRRLAEEQLLALPDGGKIDATQANRLTHALGQIVVNWGYFAGDPKLVSNAIGMIEERLDELGSGKLVVFANYKMSVALIQETFRKVKCVAINGEVSPKEKAAAIASFTEDKGCRLIVINPKSGGMGLDGLQHVSNHCMFVEPVAQPRDFHQCVARLKRTGQTKRVVVDLPTAEGTLQVRTFKNLLENDTTVNKVVHNATDLRTVLFGG
jgi:SNF2 family DNA or RNA helicase